MRLICLLLGHKRSRLKGMDDSPIIEIIQHKDSNKGRPLHIQFDFCSRCTGLFGYIEFDRTHKVTEIEVLSGTLMSI